MSVVTEILSSAGMLAKDSLQTKISKLSSRLHDVKQDLHELIKESYCDFTQTLTTCDKINSQIAEIENESKTLQETFSCAVNGQIEEASSEYSHLLKEYKKTNELVTALGDLNFIYTNMDFNLDKIKINMSTEYLNETACIIDQVCKKFQSLEGSVLAQTQIFIALKHAFLLKRQTFCCELSNTWDDVIQWEFCEDEELTTDKNDKVKLTINFDDKHCGAEDLINNLEICGILNEKTTDFAKNCFDNFISKLILNPNSLLEIKKTTVSILFNVEDKPKEEESDYSDDDVKDDLIDQPISPLNTFFKVKEFLLFLNENLLTVTAKDTPLMETFSETIHEETIELLVSACLSKTVPTTKDQLQEYDEVKKMVSDFENFLKKILFIPKTSETNELTNFASDIHFHFSRRSCNNLIIKAKKLMKMDLHETIEINGKNEGINQIWLNRMDQNLENQKLAMVKREHKVKEFKDQTSFKLPRMRISKGAKCIVEMVLEVLKQASEEQAESSCRLYETAKNIIQLYIAIVPTFHKESILKLPQVSVIHYNDCYYISHHLFEATYYQLPAQWSWKIEQAVVLQDLGCICLLDQVKRQHEILFDSLSPLKTLNNIGEKCVQADKPIRQVIHQLQYLRRVWFEFLPLEILLKSLSTLVDSVLGEVTSSICAIEDMTSDDSSQLRTLCSNLQDKIGIVFEQCRGKAAEKKDLTWQRNLSKWQRMKELIFILDGSLMDIVDRWTDGKGPLAICFTALEIRSLIRALFQNTDRRSNALSKIRY